MTYFNNKKNNANQQTAKSVPGRKPDGLVTVPGTSIEISLWTATPGSTNAGCTSVGFDRCSYNADGTKRRNRTFRFSHTDDLVGLLLGVIGSLEIASQDESLPGNHRTLYARLADEAGKSVADAMDPTKPQVANKAEMSLNPALAAPSANGQAIDSAASSLLS